MEVTVVEAGLKSRIVIKKIVGQSINKTQILYNNFPSQISIKNWIILLNSEAMWYMEDKKLLSTKMIEFLIENHHFRRNIWKIVEDNFN